MLCIVVGKVNVVMMMCVLVEILVVWFEKIFLMIRNWLVLLLLIRVLIVGIVILLVIFDDWLLFRKLMVKFWLLSVVLVVV